MCEKEGRQLSYLPLLSCPLYEGCLYVFSLPVVSQMGNYTTTESSNIYFSIDFFHMCSKNVPSKFKSKQILLCLLFKLNIE